MTDINQPGRPDKKSMKVTQQVFHNLAEIVELYPQYSIAQHLSAILRRKSEEGTLFHLWKNDELLKKIEQHKVEMEGEELMNEGEDQDY